MDEEIKKEFKKVNKEIRGIKKTLKNCATKDDLKKFATKDDLKDFATKDDLKDFATKDDLKDFATKDDLKDFATKDDLKDFAKKKHLRKFATQIQLEEFKIWAEEKFVTREYFDKFIPLFERIMEEIKKNQYERQLYIHKYDLLDNKVLDHEKRLKLLETVT